MQTYVNKIKAEIWQSKQYTELQINDFYFSPSRFSLITKYNQVSYRLVVRALCLSAIYICKYNFKHSDVICSAFTLNSAFELSEIQSLYQETRNNRSVILAEKCTAEIKLDMKANLRHSLSCFIREEGSGYGKKPKTQSFPLIIYI